MPDLSIHLAPHSPWVWLVLGTLALATLASWAYRFALPPLSPFSRRALSLLRGAALLALLWLLAQPVLERGLPASGRRVTVLVDRSASMDLPSARGGPSRADVAAQVVRGLRAALHGRAAVEVRSFAAALAPDTGVAGVPRQATALGDALERLAGMPIERRPDGVIVVSDGIVNAGDDPVAGARALGVPVHAVRVGEPLGADRAVAEVESSREARVGEPTPVRVHVHSTEPRGTPIGVRLLEDGREIARGRVNAPGPGAEAIAELRVTPVRPGLAVWTARVDPLAGDLVPGNDARGVAVQVAPGRLGVLVVSGGLNWDLAFLRRAWSGDSSLSVLTKVRARDGWNALERAGGGEPNVADLRGRAFVVLDGIAAYEVGPAFDRALADFVRNGGGLLLLGGPAPGLERVVNGSLSRELALPPPSGPDREVRPVPTSAADELLAWDEDAARGDAAWRTAAPLASVLPIRAGAGDRVLLAGADGAPLVFTRRAGRGPVMMVNGTGFWRWALSGTDALAADRARLMWRHVARWLAEPVQGEPLRVTPSRWLTPAGELVRLIATLQDAEFRPVAGATVRGEATGPDGARAELAFTAGDAGSYVAELPSPAPGRWRVRVRSAGGRAAAASAQCEFAVDAWTLEMLRAEPDTATLASMAEASGGRSTGAAGAARWARTVETRELVRRRTTSTRLWESPWFFGVVVGVLAAEWIWRRRRGLP
jgi:hypothetical protein